MFMKFTLYVNNNDWDGPVGDLQVPEQKICLNIKDIEFVQQSGKWRNTELARQHQTFILHNDRFILQMRGGNSYTVKGIFEEFCDTLANFQDNKEVV